MKYTHHKHSLFWFLVKLYNLENLMIFSRIFQRKISANRLALVGMMGG